MKLLFDKQCGESCWSSQQLLKLADSLLCFFILFPSMLLYWRGIWDLLDTYVLPDSEQPFKYWVMSFVGTFAIFGYCIVPVLDAGLPRDRKYLRGIVARGFMYGHGLLVMFYWRGVWGLGEYYLAGFGWVGSVAGLLLCYGLLTALRVSRSVIFPPFSVTMDTRDDVLKADTLFKTRVGGTDSVTSSDDVSSSSSSSAQLYVIDSCATHCVITTLTIITWRSGMSLIDSFLYPDQPSLADLSSFLIGALGSAILMMLDGKFAKMLTDLTRGGTPVWVVSACEDGVYLITFMVEVFLWRGAWNLTCTYFLPDPLMGGWVCHLLGTILMFCLQVFSYAGFCGCGHNVTDVKALSEGTFYPTQYLRAYLACAATSENARINKQISEAEGIDVEGGEGREVAGFLPLNPLGGSKCQLEISLEGEERYAKVIMGPEIQRVERVDAGEEGVGTSSGGGRKNSAYQADLE